ncbi:MAG: trigger factor [Candidatus Nomurabacteria bacterium]|nr:MAG: trigger factor [Candidatus Nomurabacteria bacterium]HRV76021.1 trigger factor [Candidatus Saccharimonadales bacterium]
MKLTINYDKNSAIKFKVLAELDAKDLSKQKNRAIKKMGDGVKIPGFRSGTAPAKLIEERLDENQVRNEVASGCIDVAFAALIKEFNLDIIGTPKLEIRDLVDGEKMAIEFIGNIKPEITLPDYAKWPKVKINSKVDLKEIDLTLEQLRENMAQSEDVDRAAKNGDKVWLDFDGRDENGEKIPGAQSNNYPLILGSRSFIPGFEEEVVGLKAGDEKEFKITFPKDYHAKSLQNKKVVFKIKIQKVTELKKPELNDEFAKKIGGFDTLEALRKDIEIGLTERAERDAKEDTKDKLAEKLGEETKMEIPDVLVDENIEAGLHNAKHQAESSGKKWEDFVKESGFKDEEELIAKEARPQAEKQVKISLALRALAEKEKLEVTKEELSEYTSVLLQQYTNPQAQTQIMSENEQARIEGRLLADKVLNFLLSKVS